MISLTTIIIWLVNILFLVLAVVLIFWVFRFILSVLQPYVQIPTPVLQILSVIFGLLVLLFVVRMFVEGAYLIRI